MRTMTSKLGAFARSVALLGVFAVAIPWLLVAAAQARFGGAAPWSAMPGPSSWSVDAVWSSLTDRLSEATLADLVIRVGLAVAWIAIIVLFATAIAEAVHMVRHAGLSMPEVRGLGGTQRLARVIASGLLVVVPVLSSPGRTIAQDVPLLPTFDRPATVLEREGARPGHARLDALGALADHTSSRDPGAFAHTTASAAASGGLPRAPSPASPGFSPAEAAPAADDSIGTSVEYEVVQGDSVYAIAQRVVGPDPAAVADYADELLELNLGRQMGDGQWFTNAAYIDVGWVLTLPPVRTVGEGASDAVGQVVVEPGDTLWSVAEVRLGDGERWGEIFELNEGREFVDGRRLTDPQLIVPGWVLDLPEPRSAAEPVELGSEAVPHDVGAEEVPSGESAEPDQPSGGADGADGADGDADVERAVRPDNAWIDSSVAETPAPDAAPSAADVWNVAGEAVGAAAAPSTGSADSSSSPDAAGRNVAGNEPIDDRTVADAGVEQPGVELLTFERAAMLSGGVLALLAVRRRARMRSARPNSRLPEPTPAAVAVERSLRTIDAGDRFARVDIAIRNAAMALVEGGVRVRAVVIDADGELDLVASGAVDLGMPWQASTEPSRWRLPASTPIELLAEDARRVGSPCPTLVQLGRDVDGRDVYVDLEALEVLEVGGPGDQADAIVTAVAATLASSVLAEVTTLVGAGVDDEAFLGHRLHRPVNDVQQAFDEAADAIGSTRAADRSTFELRARVTSGETWEPAVVLAGSALGTVVLPSSRTGLAVVSASPVDGPSMRLVPDGDLWLLRPLGLRLVPVGLAGSDVESLCSLTAVPEPVSRLDPVVAARCTPSADPDVTLVDVDVDAEIAAAGGDAEAADLPTDVDRLQSAEIDLAEPDTASDVELVLEVAGGGAEFVDDDVEVVERGVEFVGDRMEGVDDDAAVAGDRTDVVVGDGEFVVAEPLAHALVVRLMGPVSVESTDGRAVRFERSKTKELVAWLATHRERATRANARAALWELDVRDATFANVVSEARRALARLVDPPEGDEWVGRTMTDALPLHPLVVTDLELIEHAIDAARLQPPNLAIETLRPAVEWVVGVPFEGTSYLWPDAEGITSDLVLRAITVTNALAEHCLSVGDIDGVFAATARGLQVLPAHEDMIAVRMRAYASVGDRAGVRHEWETYERAIVSDPWSDGEPSDRMLQLRRELLSA